MTETPSAPFVRPLSLGDTGPDVLAVKRALKKAGHGQGVAPTYRMGATAVRDLRSFQRMCKLDDDGVYGPATHKFLAPYFDADGIRLLTEEQAKLAQLTGRDRFLQIADQTVQHVALFDYTMTIGDGPGQRGYWRVMPDALNWDSHARRSTDCSQHFIGCGRHAGLTHPIFETSGATGSILGLERITLAEAQPGDAVVYVGSRYPAGEHVTILREKLANGDWRVINMGTQGQPGYRLLSQETAGHPSAPEMVVLRLPT